MSTGLPAQAYAAAVAVAAATRPNAIADLITSCPPAEAFAVCRGELSPPPAARSLRDGEFVGALRAAARAVDVHALWARCIAGDGWVTYLGAADYPAVLAADLAPPTVLFGRGDVGLLGGRRAAIVGTRGATGAGRATAADFGRQLAEAGVHVVSGLARGIDGAAHRGVLGALGGGIVTKAPAAPFPDKIGRPIGVVACGLDRPYPGEHAALWDNVARVGLLVTEYPPGAEPLAYRFPARNRIIAALAEVVVVVESRATGGSLITSDEAERRGITVMAVPGSVTNPCATGTNQLLRDGGSFALCAQDVLTVLSIDHRRAAAAGAGPPPLAGHEAEVWRCCAGGPRTIEHVVLACGLSVAEAATALVSLLGGGWLRAHDGFYEAVER